MIGAVDTQPTDDDKAQIDLHRAAHRAEAWHAYLLSKGYLPQGLERIAKEYRAKVKSEPA